MILVEFGVILVIFGDFVSFWVILGDCGSFWVILVILGDLCHLGHFG